MTAGDQPRYEHLMAYLYQSAIGLVQTNLQGEVQLINPVAVNLLMPLARQGDFLDNLFTTLDPYVPDLPRLAAGFTPAAGTLLKSHRIALPTGTRGHGEPVHYALTMVKVAADTLMASVEDISVEVRREVLLNKQDAWINAMMAGVSRHALVQLDVHGCIAGWNADMAALFGDKPFAQSATAFAAASGADHYVGQPYAILFPSDAITSDRMVDRLEEVRHTGLSFAEGWMHRSDGSRFWGHTLITASEPGAQPASFNLVVRDISDHRESMESLLRQATSDQLTGVANRRAFHEAADMELARYQRKPRDIALLLVDIDHFKQVNDTYGHPVGDQVIRNLAEVMLRSVRSIDVVARLGGEEFAVLLPSTDVAMGRQIAERIRANVSKQAVRAGQHAISYRVSIGVATVVAGILTPDDLIAAADQALYEAKRHGRDRVCVHVH